MYNLADKGNHANTSVLTLNSTTTLEGLGFGLEPSKRVIYSERFSNSKVKFVHGKVGRCACNLGRSEGGGRADKEGGNGEFHFNLVVVLN
mmetsp:Transcript_1603/g.1897  ORF Transcript_1603/g.1897 Transcript_1603/m.1897 type:complete len:90 (+) Transcript_1603:643-912(+)